MFPTLRILSHSVDFARMRHARRRGGRENGKTHRVGHRVPNDARTAGKRADGRTDEKSSKGLRSRCAARSARACSLPGRCRCCRACSGHADAIARCKISACFDCPSALATRTEFSHRQTSRSRLLATRSTRVFASVFTLIPTKLFAGNYRFVT